MARRRPCPFQRWKCHYVAVFRDPQGRKMSADRVRHVARGEMRVVLFGHPRVRVAELSSDDTHGHAAHGKRGAVRVTKHVE